MPVINSPMGLSISLITVSAPATPYNAGPSPASMPKPLMTFSCVDNGHELNTFSMLSILFDKPGKLRSPISKSFAPNGSNAKLALFLNCCHAWLQLHVASFVRSIAPLASVTCATSSSMRIAPRLIASANKGPLRCPNICWAMARASDSVAACSIARMYAHNVAFGSSCSLANSFTALRRPNIRLPVSTPAL